MANSKFEIRNSKFLRSGGCTIGDQDEGDYRVTARDSNAEAYEVMAEIQITVRRIVHRGLEKVAGKTWYLDGCPPGVFERLVERKENEIAIDRFDDEYQELISFASLDDLAEIIEYNEDLSKLLAAIAPKDTIVDRLREIEALRLKLAATVPLDDTDIDNLLDHHQQFREALARRLKNPGEETPLAAPAPAAGTAADPDAEKNAAADESPADDFGTLVIDVAALRAENVEPTPDHRTVVAETDLSASNGQMNSSEEVVEVERAMASGDHVEVLRVLHHEVISVAEAVYQRDVDRTYPVWETLRASGWYDRKKADMALAPLELFYAAAEEARDRQRSGADLDELKAYLVESEFSNLLLSLREMFMRHQL